jgi:hypothetical protein
MSFLLPPACEESNQDISFPRDNARIAAELAAVTEVTEEAVYVMRAALRGTREGQTGADRALRNRSGRKRASAPRAYT